MNALDGLSQLVVSLAQALPALQRFLRFARHERAWPFVPAQSYENLFLDITVDLQDAAGRKAVVTRRQKVRFLTEEAGVLTAPIWGEGERLKRFTASGARKLGERPDGPHDVVLLGLARPAKKGDVVAVESQQTILDGFRDADEYADIVLERPTKKLRLQVLFPRERPPSAAYVMAGNRTIKRRMSLRVSIGKRPHLSYLLSTPRPGITYSLRWSW